MNTVRLRTDLIIVANSLIYAMRILYCCFLSIKKLCISNYEEENILNGRKIRLEKIERLIKLYGENLKSFDKKKYTYG